VHRITQPKAVWLFPPTYALHLIEEYLVAGGWPLWAESTLGVHFNNSEFIAWNVFALGLMCVGVWLVSRNAKFRFIEIALAVAVLGNGLAHVLVSLVTGTYSPGLVTGVVVWTPLSVVCLRDANEAVTRKARLAGLYLGLGVVLVTVAVVAFRTRISH
jgi:Protein of unknown function with HXXEE motif